MIRDKQYGGVGFKELKVFNIRPLAKMMARVLTELDALWVMLLNGLYFEHVEFMEVTNGARASWGWSSLVAGRDVLCDERFWIVGDIAKIKLAKDAWIYKGSNTRIQHQLITPVVAKTNQWDEYIRKIVPDETAMDILKVPLSIYVNLAS